MNNTVIILAAGSGTRMKIEKSKLLLEINGKTVIERSVNAFLDIDDVTNIIIAARQDDINEFSRLVKDSRVTFVTGGATRQESVKNAVSIIKNTDYIIIHDGARPLVKKADIISVIDAAYDSAAAAVGVFVKDTIKIVDGDNFVVDTPDRAKLFAVQTPQVFSFDLYKKALDKASSDGKDFTDDCQLVEYIGARVKMVSGSYDNIKITTPDDISLAENILKQGEGL